MEHPLSDVHVSRRAALAGAGLLGSAVLVAACGAAGAVTPGQEEAAPGAAGEQPASSGEVTTVVAYLSVSGDSIAQWEEGIVAPFEAENPNINLELSPQPGGSAGMREKLQVQLAAGVPLDVWEYAAIAETMAENDWLIPIDTYVARDQYDLTVFAPKLFDFYTRYDGKLWTIPWGHGGNTFVMALNRQIFDEAGIGIPSADLAQTWDWDDWIDTGLRLTKRQGDTVERFGIADQGGWWSHTLLWDTDWVSEDLKTITSDNPDMIEGMTNYFDMVVKYRTVPKPGELDEVHGMNRYEVFNNGLTGVERMPPYAITEFTRVEQKVPLVLAPSPIGKRSVPDVNWHSFGIINGSKNPDASWEVIKYLLEDGRYAIFFGKIPSQTSLHLSWLEDEFKDLPDVNLAAATNSLEAAVPQTRLFRLNWSAVYPVMRDQFNERVYTGKDDVATVLKELKPVLQAIVEN